MYTEQEKRIQYYIACINEFASAKKLDRGTAYRYLLNNKAILFLKDHYDVEHTLSIQDAITDITHVCKRHGGQIS